MRALTWACRGVEIGSVGSESTTEQELLAWKKRELAAKAVEKAAARAAEKA